MTESRDTQPVPILLRARAAFAEVIEARGLSDASIDVTTRTLTTEEAIGEPIYDDLPILRGKEVMIEAEFRGARGHAFTSSPSSWSGSLRELLAMPVETNRQRALLSAAMNAVLRSLGLVQCTVHCLSQDITRCGKQIAVDLHHEFGPIPVGVIGYQPGLVAGLVEEFSPDRVRVTDLLEENLARRAHGVEIWDGLTRTEDLVRVSRLILATGSTAANNTLDDILALTEEAGVPLILFGVTAAAVCYLCGLRRICLLAS